MTPCFEPHHKLSFAFASAGMGVAPNCFHCPWKWHYDRGRGNTLLGAKKLFKGRFIVLQRHIRDPYFFQIFPLISYDLGAFRLWNFSICFLPKHEVANLDLLKIFILLWGFVSNRLVAVGPWSCSPTIGSIGCSSGIAFGRKKLSHDGMAPYWRVVCVRGYMYRGSRAALKG